MQPQDSNTGGNGQQRREKVLTTVDIPTVLFLERGDVVWSLPVHFDGVWFGWELGLWPQSGCACEESRRDVPSLSLRSFGVHTHR